MARLTGDEREELIRRRGCISDGDGQAHRISNLDIHHNDRNTNNNDPRNLRVLTKQEHQDLHSKYGK